MLNLGFSPPLNIISLTISAVNLGPTEYTRRAEENKIHTPFRRLHTTQMSLYIQDAEDQMRVFHKFWLGALLVNMEFLSSANGDRATSNGLRLSNAPTSSGANELPARFYGATKSSHCRSGGRCRVVEVVSPCHAVQARTLFAGDPRSR